MARRRRFLANLLQITLALLVVGAGVGLAANTLKIAVAPGVTVVNFEGIDIQIETSAEVFVYLTVSDGDIYGSVEPAPGVRASTVTITRLGTPDTVIFKGRVTSPIDFTEYIFTQETGRGEQ